MKATPESAPASIDRFMSLLKEHENRIGETIGILQNIKTPSEQIRQAMEASSAARSAVIAEVERLAAQSAPTEIHADTPRHELLPRLRRLASDFQSHPLSRSISECEEAGIAMAEAAKQIEMLCRTRNTVVNHSGRMRKEIAALTEHRDFLLREIAKIDGDPGNACHYAIEAISAVCADLAEPVPPLPEGVKARFKCEDCDGTGYTGEMIPGSEFQPPEPVGCTSCNFTGWWAECEAFSVDQMRAYIDADRAAAQVEPPQAQGQDAAPAEQPQDDEPTWQELEDFRKRHWTHWNAADNLLIAHLAQKLKCAARAKE